MQNTKSGIHVGYKIQKSSSSGTTLDTRPKNFALRIQRKPKEKQNYIKIFFYYTFKINSILNRFDWGGSILNSLRGRSILNRLSGRSIPNRLRG